jgi:serine/threonine-protein kinase PknK
MRELGRRYRLERLLGAGGASTTYAAHDAVRDETVALKLVRAGLDDTLRAEFVRLSGLVHPHLVQVHDLGRERDGQAYFTCSLVDGPSLAQASDVLPRLGEALEGLRFLHRLGIVHGDFKPDNVIVGRDGAVLIDLGCSRLEGRAGAIAGTPGFIAPEVLRGETADRRADLYAVGATIAALLPKEHALAERLLRDDPRERPNDVDEVLEALGLHAPPFDAPAQPARLLGREREVERVEAAGKRAVILRGPPGAGRTRLLEELKWRAQLRSEVIEGDARRPDAVRALLARAAERELPQGMSAVLEARAAAGRPLVLVLDDAMLLRGEDRRLWDALLDSLEADDRWFVIATTTAEVAPRALVEVVELAPLGVDDTRAWLDGILAPAHAEAARQVTGGFPAALRALARLLQTHAVSEGDVARGRVRLDASPDVAGLSPDAARALAYIAAGGAAAPVPELAARGLVVVEGGAARLPRLGDAAAILDALPHALVAEVHGELAEEREGAERLGHLVAAERLDEAERLLAAVEPDEVRADAWLEAARALAAHRPGSLLAVADLHLAAGQPREALSYLARLLRRQPEARLSVTLRAARAYQRLGKDALRRVRRALALPLAPAERARALDCLARVLIARGAYAEALAAAREGLALEPDEADLHDDAGVAASYLGQVHEARAALAAAAALHERHGRPRARARSASYAALAAFRGGDAPAAAAGYREALALAERAGAADLVANAALNLGAAAHQLGDLGEARRGYERALGLARLLGQRGTEVTLRANLAKLYVDIGLFDRAAVAAELALGRAREEGRALLAGASLAAQGELAGLRGDTAVAEERLREARAIFAGEGALREVSEVDAQLASLLGRDDGAALAAARELGAADLIARARLAAGRVLVARGEHAAALVELEAALAGSEGQRLLEAEVRGALVEVWERRGASGLASRERLAARALWERAAAALPARYADAFWAHPLRQAVAEPSAGRSRREAKLERLLQLNKKLNSSLDPDAILAFAMDSAIDLTGAERGLVLLARDGAIEVAVSRNIDGKSDSEQIAFSTSIARAVIDRGNPVISLDASGDERFRAQASIHAMRLSSVLCAPICAPEGIVGALYLDHRYRRALFGDEDRALLTAFADQVAIALTNARLHAELAARTAELERERARIAALADGQAERIDALATQLRRQQEVLASRYDYQSIVGSSPRMRALFATLDRVVDSDVTVLISGESGTGKELVARAIHVHGPRRDGPFVAINCGAVPETLIESELFGHVRGAFTGAERDREGLFVRGRGGTVFLDELGEMPRALQVKLLRVLQEREVTPLGATAPVPIDARVLCATNRRLRDEVAAGRFREDLFYRVSVLELELPPLRERLDDLPALAARVLEGAAERLGRDVPALGPEAMAALARHAWPGNVRELENVLTKALLLAEGPTITAEHLALAPTAEAGALARDRAAFAAQEAAEMLAVLRSTRWNVSEACRALRMPRATFYRKLQRYGLARG